jgi:hypothetical protein
MKETHPSNDELFSIWNAAWPKALELWGQWIRLSAPRMATNSFEVKEWALDGVLACIRMATHGVHVNLPLIRERKLAAFPMQILAHEVGHHVFVPGTLLDHFRILAQVRKGLPTFESRVPEIANVWSDLLVNDHIHRVLGLPMDGPYRVMRCSEGLIWNLYMRTCERLWGLPKGELCDISAISQEWLDSFEADAWLASQTVRVYANEAIRGAGRFAALSLVWLQRERENQNQQWRQWMDMAKAGHGCSPPAGLGLDEEEDPVHPSEDSRVTGDEEKSNSIDGDAKGRKNSNASGQAHSPWEYGEVLKLGGLELDPKEAAKRFYREKALTNMVACPSIELPSSPDPLPEGLDPWEAGDAVDTLDVLQSVLISPTLIPGVTTVSRHWGEQPGTRQLREPLDLDLYIDSSGSMPNPAVDMSWPALAATMVSLSVLRRGGRVQVTLWSGKTECLRTPGFIRDEDQILDVICSHFGHGTTFPLHALRETWKAKSMRRAHILHISDDGLFTLFDGMDELGNKGWDLAQLALKHCGGGGTMALQIQLERKYPAVDRLIQARDEQGWDLYPVSSEQGLLDFAREFSATHGSRESQLGTL